MFRTGIERLCAAATAVMLVPVWLVRWFPTQDGPSHLYNALIFANGGQLASHYFIRNLTLFPNWTTYAMMAALARVTPALAVQKIAISLCVVAVPLAVIYLQRSFKDDVDPSALIGCLLAYSYPLFMGFFNFVIASALFAAAVGYWWRRRESPNLIALYAILALTYLSHGLPFAAAVMAIVLLAAFERRWRTMLHLAPALLLLAFDVVSRAHATREYRSLLWHLRELGVLGPFNVFSPAIAIAAGAAILAFILLQRSRPDPMVIVTAALLLGFFVAPWGYGAHQAAQGEWISDRLLFLAVLTIPAWLTVPRPRLAMAMAVFVALLAAHIVVTSAHLIELSDRLSALMSCAPHIRAHSTLDVIGTRPQISERIAPALHAPAYFAALQNDVVYLGDYEARLAEFPLSFRRDAPRRAPDYLLVWHSAGVRNVVGYHTICATADYRLMAR